MKEDVMKKRKEELDRVFSAALDSVSVIKKISSIENPTEKELKFLENNMRHLLFIKERYNWAGYDVSEILTAIETVKNKIGV